MTRREHHRPLAETMTDRELAAILDADADEIVKVKARIELDRRAAARPANRKTKIENEN